jgi:hypothetical protein
MNSIRLNGTKSTSVVADAAIPNFCSIVWLKVWLSIDTLLASTLRSRNSGSAGDVATPENLVLLLEDLRKRSKCNLVFPHPEWAGELKAS